MKSPDRSIKSFLLTLCILLALFLNQSVTTEPVRAATITVNSTADVIDGEDGLCTLREAIIAANEDEASEERDFNITTVVSANAESHDRAEPPVITSADTATFTIGINNSFTITTTGNPTPANIWYTGSLGDGVEFINNADGTATIRGIPGPESDEEYVLVIYASNGVEPDASQAFTLRVVEKTYDFPVFLPLILR